MSGWSKDVVGLCDDEARYLNKVGGLGRGLEDWGEGRILFVTRGGQGVETISLNN